MDKAKKSRKKLIIDIICYSVIGICFLFALIGVLLKFAGKSVYLFGSRFDVVLTDSMSEMNPRWEDFLKGHDDQIQAFDLVASKEVTSPKDIGVYDIVIFDNKNIGTDMHRIVRMVPDTSDDIVIERSTISKIGDYSGIMLPYIDSDFVSNAISIQEITLVTYSLNDYDEGHYYFNVQNTDWAPVITTESVSGGFIKTYHVKRNATSPGNLVISHRYEFDYSSEIITSCTIKNASDDIVINTETMHADGENLVGTFNQTYLYEIRGDKAPTSDGLFSIDKIQSKVYACIPKMGYIIRFLSSIWGTVMFIGLGFLVIAFDIFASKIEKKQAETAKPSEKEPIEEKEEKTDE